MPNEEWRLQRLIQAIQLLAADYDVQVTSLPEFVDIPGEVALTFEDCLIWADPLIKKRLISDEQIAKIQEIGHEFDQMDSDEFWTEVALQKEARWEKIRVQARELLALFGEKRSHPDLFWATYVKGGRS